MSNKKLHLVFWFILAVFVGVIWNFTSAVNFRIHFDEWLPVRAGYMRRNITSIHFKDNWNDFGWFIYFSNGTNMEGEEAEGTGDYEVKIKKSTSPDVYDIFECQQRVRWFYYNAERGERLWALDDSYSIDNVEVGGWLYTRCRRKWFKDAMKICSEKSSETDRETCEEDARNNYVDSHGYYWMVTHKYLGNDYFLAVWTDYYTEAGTNQIVMWNELKPTLIRFDNKYPVWFIYDANGGLWFIWWEIIDLPGIDNEIAYILSEVKNNNDDWTPLFYLTWNGIWSYYLPIDTSKWWSAMNSLISVVVDWLVWINRDTKNQGIQWNQGNDKMQYFSSVDINNMQLINYARQKAEILCRGKWTKYNGDGSYGPSLKSLYCFDDSNVEGPILAKVWTTIIVKNYDVQVEDMDNFNEVWNYDIFIDNGDLIIKEVTSDYKVFKKNWFISEWMSLNDFSWKVMPILLNSDSLYTWDEVAAWKFIKWNFIVNGGVKSDDGLGLNHVYFVYWKMTTKNTVDQLWKVFKWRCKSWELWTDNTPCPGTEENVDGSVLWTNPYENASLVIIDQNYPSPLYK